MTLYLVLDQFVKFINIIKSISDLIYSILKFAEFAMIVLVNLFWSIVYS